jgi:hypothetical protein
MLGIPRDEAAPKRQSHGRRPALSGATYFRRNKARAGESRLTPR